MPRTCREERSMSVEEDDKALCNRGVEAISRGDFDAIDEIYAPDNAQKLKEMLTEVRRAFPDFYGMNVIQIAEGDQVLNRTVLHGTHLGEFQGLTPTGKRVTVEDRKSTRLNSSHANISYAVFC